jgi:zinc transporter, ZIP family
MSVLFLAFIGGIVSAVSTSTGSLIAPLFSKIEKIRKYHLSMDFALGVMLSAVAFSLVGPELLRADHLLLSLSGLAAGSLFILLTHKAISFLNREEKYNSQKVLLVAALIFHNLPEGMGAGASLAGMALNQAIPLQVAIALQNVMEGLLLTLLLQSLGLRLSYAVLGGIGSGVIEMLGAISAGLMLESTQALLPFLLTLAGGAMMMSVLLELRESFTHGKSLQRSHFITGLMIIPLTNMIFSI